MSVRHSERASLVELVGQEAGGEQGPVAVAEIAVGERRRGEVGNGGARWWRGDGDELLAVERDDDVRDRARGDESHDAVNGRAQRERGEDAAVDDAVGKRPRCPREQSRRDGVLDQRRRREPRAEHLQRERDVEQPRVRAAHLFGEGDAGRARRAELLPEVG